MNTIKRLFSIAALAASMLFFPTVSSAQIPTTDVANLVQQIIAYQARVQAYITQYEQYKNMIDQLKAATGARDLKALLGIKEVKDALSKADFDAISNLAVGAEYGQFQNPVADEVIKSMKSVSAKVFDRAETINTLRSKAGATQDQKEALALNAQIAAESLKLQNETMNMIALQSAGDAKEKQIQIRRDEEVIKYLKSGDQNPFK